MEWTRLPNMVNQTRRLMENPSVSAIFEATFHIDGYTTRANVLVRNGDGWRHCRGQIEPVQPRGR